MVARQGRRVEIPLAHCVRGGMVRTIGWGKRKRWAAGDGMSVASDNISAAHLFPL